MRSNDPARVSNNYILNKPPGRDSAKKQQLSTDFQVKIKNAKPHERIDLMIEIGNKADEQQEQGWVHSNFTDLGYMQILNLYETVCKEQLAELEERIRQKNEELSALKQEYIQNKKDSVENLEPTLTKIKDTIHQLVYIGDNPLEDLFLSDIDELFPREITKGMSYVQQGLSWFGRKPDTLGYYYCEDGSIPGAIIYFPVVAQKEIFGEYYRRIYGSEMKSEEKNTPLDVLPRPKKFVTLNTLEKIDEEIKDVDVDILSSAFRAKFCADIDDYISVSDNDKNKKKCTLLKDRLKEIKTSKECLNFVIELGYEADKTQREGWSSSRGASLLHKLRHDLCAEIEKNAPDAYRFRIKKEERELALRRNNAREGKLKNLNRVSIEKLEHLILKQIIEMAYLRQMDPLLALSPAKLKTIYPNDLVSQVIWTSDIGAPGYAYSQEVDSHGKGCIYTPKVFWPNFSSVYEEENRLQFEAIRAAKAQAEKAETLIRGLTNDITKLNRYQPGEQKNAHVVKIDDEIKKIRELIKHLSEDKKIELNVKLQKQEKEFERTKALPPISYSELAKTATVSEDAKEGNQTSVGTVFARLNIKEYPALSLPEPKPSKNPKSKSTSRTASPAPSPEQEPAASPERAHSLRGRSLTRN